MRRILFGLLFATAVFAQQAHYRKHGTVLLNDLTVTPGEVRTTSKAAVCSEKTPQFRNTTEKMKNEVYAEYGVDKLKRFTAAEIPTGSAATSSVPTNLSVTQRELMTSRAVRPTSFGRERTGAPQDIHAMRDRFQMLWIDTYNISATMVEFSPAWNWTDEGSVNQHMGPRLTPPAISAAYHPIAGPLPAAGIPVHGDAVTDYPIEASNDSGHDAVLYEIDHLISLEIGGADTVKNLWPQPYYQHPGAHEKDILENWLHKQVCSGKMDLTEAQAKIRTDWYAEYLEMQKEKQ